jgi:hypothetical protein
MRLTAAKPDFLIRLNGVYIPEINVRRSADGERNELTVKDKEVGWIVVDDMPGMLLEYRDETAWALLPLEVCQASTDKGWNQATPEELIGILWVVGVLK